MTPLKPAQNFGPGIRFSLAPDGKSFVYSTSTHRNDLWMMQCYRKPGWVDRFTGVIEALRQ